MAEINKIYFASFLLGFQTIASVSFTLFFLSNGITHSEIGLLFSVFMISLALFEIPTGGFSDTFGHKTSVWVGLIIHAVSVFILFIGSNFFTFLIAMVCAALGLAFQSGAISSLVHDLLQDIKQPQSFEKVQGRIYAYFSIATVVAAPLGMAIYSITPRLPYFIAFLSTLIAASMVFIVKLPKQKQEKTPHRYVENIHQGVILTVRNQKLMALILIGISLSTARLVFNQNINQPLQLDIGINVPMIGVVAGIVAGVSALVASQMYKMSKKINATVFLVATILLPAICLFALSIIHSISGVIFIVMFYVGHAIREPLMISLSQKEVNNDQRATMISTASFVTSIIVGLLLPLWGANIDVHGIRTVLIFLGTFMVVIGGVGIYFYKTGVKEVRYQ